MVDFNNPITRVEFNTELFGIPESEIPNLFLVDAAGNGMINAGILDKDTLLCIRTNEIADGDIVVVNVEGESMLRRFFKEGTSAKLKRENGTGEQILVTDYTIVGKLVGIQRKYR